MQLASRTSCSAAVCSGRPTAVLAPISSRATSSRRTICMAESEQQQTSSAATEQPRAAAPQQTQPPAEPTSAPLLAKGQGTAIVTGAISVLFGVAYLLLVQFMDMRGGELLPPPPEAFIP